MKAKNICAITGSNGYVGGCLKHHLRAQNWEVLELTRRPADAAATLFYELGYELPAVVTQQATAFIHCAYDFKALRWEDIARINIQGSRRVLESARRRGIKKIIFVSSISAYEGCRSLYGKAKLEIEKIALDNGALVIRPGLVYGSGAGGMFGKLQQQIQKSSVIPLIGDGSQIQFLVHHGDLGDFISRYAAGSLALAPQVITAAHPQPWPFRKLLEEIARGTNKRVHFIPLPWRGVWAGLKFAEMCGLKLNFRSDSLVSLMYQNPQPDFSANAAAGLRCRPFAFSQLRA